MGEVYDGAFRNGQMHGHGIMRWPREHAQTRKDAKRAAAFGIDTPAVGIISTMAAAQGPVYNGSWREDKRHGVGVMEWPDGRRYEGFWADDTMVDAAIADASRAHAPDGESDAGDEDGVCDAPNE